MLGAGPNWNRRPPLPPWNKQRSIDTEMTGQWLADLVSNASVDLQRTQCAEAAMRRASAVGVNIDGLDTGEHERRRTVSERSAVAIRSARCAHCHRAVWAWR
eukprot:COSAG06_NODE_991_length_11174_cov_3.912686_10_plen_102_part_00